MAVVKRRGKWVLDYYDQHGKRRWETAQGNQKEAKELLAQRLLEIGRGDYLSPKERNVPFTEFAEGWLNGREAKIRPATIGQYRNHVDKHLSPFFGSVLVGCIDMPRVDAYISHKKREHEGAEVIRIKARTEQRQLTAEERTKTQGAIGIATINKTLTTLGTMFKYAVKAKLLDSNPISLIERPKQEALEYSEDNEKVQFLTPEQIHTLLEKAEPGLYRTLLTTAIMTGMRQEELLAIRWGEVDWVSGQMLVRRTLSRDNGEWKFYEPKNRTSRRNIDVDPALLLELKKWRLKLGESELDDLVFPSPSGDPLHRSTLYKQGYLPAIRRSGVPRIRFHDLRHTYASLLIDQGEHPKYIQAQMGHSSINITMDVYGHLMTKVNVKSANKLAKTIFGEDIGDSGSKSVAK